MPEGIISAIAKWVSDHLSPRYLTVTALITGLLLFLPPYVLAYFGLTGIVSKYRGVIALMFATAFLLTVTYPIELEYRDWTLKRKIRKHLNNLTGSERTLLKRCWLNNGAAIPVVHDLGTARSLEKKGILWQSAERLDRPDFNITDSAYRVLREPEFSEMFAP